MTDMWEGRKNWDDYAQAIRADQLHAESLELADRVSRGLSADAYLHDPVRWMDTFIDWKGGGLASYQRSILDELCTKKRVAVRGPHSLGKSAMAALTVVWFALTRDRAGIDWKVVSTATAWRHLTIYLWPEIHKWIKRVKWDEFGMSPPNSRTQLLDLRLKLMHGAASAVASDDPVNIEGAHADSLLYLFDESKGIPPEVWDAAEGALAGGMPEGYPEALAFAISTPGAPSGRFYDIHARKKGLEDWHPVHVSVDEVIRAGRINPDWVEQRKLQFGEDSAVFMNRVLGEFCAADEDAVIPLAWVEAAIERWHEWDEAGRPLNPVRPVLSIDVARSGSDQTVFAWRQENVVTHFSAHTKRDTMAVTALAQQDAGRASGMFSSTGFPKIVVDAVGVGAGVYDRLKELKYDVTAHVGSARTHIRDESGQFQFANARSAALWTTRELLDPANGANICLPDDDEMIGELTAPKWTVTTGAPPRIQVEKKEDVHKRLGRSPDRADAICQSLYLERIKRAGTPVSSGAHTFANADITRGPAFPLPEAGQGRPISPFANLTLGTR